MTTHRQRKNDKTHAAEIGDDLRITKTTRREAAGGTWVDGTLAGQRFQALVFPQHADYSDYELGNSRISKLWVQRTADKTTVVDFDRGWDQRPANAIAAAIVDFLSAGLAEMVYHA
jgi:hypothetical protein